MSTHCLPSLPVAFFLVLLPAVRCHSSRLRRCSRRLSHRRQHRRPAQHRWIANSDEFPRPNLVCLPCRVGLPPPALPLWQVVSSPPSLETPNPNLVDLAGIAPKLEKMEVEKVVYFNQVTYSLPIFLMDTARQNLNY
jgi:hypothetical protein